MPDSLIAQPSPSLRYLKTLISKEDHRLDLIYEFNMLPTRFVHETRLSRILDSIRGFIDVGGRAESRLSHHLLKVYGIEGKYCFNFEPEWRRLALVPGEQLRELAFLAGAAANSARVRRVVQRREVLAVREQLGEKVYNFALKKAPFLMGNTEFTGLPDTSELDIYSATFENGMALIENCLANEPEAILKRVALKFPDGQAPHFKRTQVSEKDKLSAWRILKKIFLQEVDAQWKPVFS